MEPPDLNAYRYEESRPLPEVCVLGDVLYQVIYAGDGTPDHAIRWTDSLLAGWMADVVSHLWELGEPIREFFGREIARLPPPPTTGPLTPGRPT